MRSHAKRILTALALTLLGSSTAHAAVLVTPLADSFAPANQIVECVVTNYGLTPATVVAGLFDANGALINTTVDTCNGTPLQPGVTCLLHGDPAPAYCRVNTSTPRVHAALEVWDATTDRLQVVVPAFKP